jgi:hypothetical protein
VIQAVTIFLEGFASRRGFNLCGRRTRSPKITIQMNRVIKFGLAAFAAGAFSTLPSKADNNTPDSFTRHGLPIPGAYFKNRESLQPATIAVSKSEKGVGREKQTISKSGKKHTEHVRPAK